MDNDKGRKQSSVLRRQRSFDFGTATSTNENTQGKASENAGRPAVWLRPVLSPEAYAVKLLSNSVAESSTQTEVSKNEEASADTKIVLGHGDSSVSDSNFDDSIKILSGTSADIKVLSEHSRPSENQHPNRTSLQTNNSSTENEPINIIVNPIYDGMKPAVGDFNSTSIDDMEKGQLNTWTHVGLRLHNGSSNDLHKQSPDKTKINFSQALSESTGHDQLSVSNILRANSAQINTLISAVALTQLDENVPSNDIISTVDRSEIGFAAKSSRENQHPDDSDSVLPTTSTTGVQRNETINDIETDINSEMDKTIPGDTSFDRKKKALQDWFRYGKPMRNSTVWCESDTMPDESKRNSMLRPVESFEQVPTSLPVGRRSTLGKIFRKTPKKQELITSRGNLVKSKSTAGTRNRVSQVITSGTNSEIITIDDTSNANDAEQNLNVSIFETLLNCVPHRTRRSAGRNYDSIPGEDNIERDEQFGLLATLATLLNLVSCSNTDTNSESDREVTDTVPCVCEDESVCTCKSKRKKVDVELSTAQRGWKHFKTGTKKLFHALKVSTPAILLVAYSVISAAVIYFAEHYSTQVIYDNLGQHKQDCVGNGGFLRALYYVNTLYTTIGYGNVYSCTTVGRCLTVIIILIGIPLAFIVLDAMGRILTGYISQAYSKVKTILERHLIERVKTRLKVSPSKEGTVRQESNQKPQNLPISLGVSLTVGWILLCAGFFSSTEQWSYPQSLYFTFISLTTVGLGDIAPTRYNLTLVNFSCVVVGLALVSMSIKIVQDNIESLFIQMVVEIENEALEEGGKLEGQEGDGCERGSLVRQGSDLRNPLLGKLMSSTQVNELKRLQQKQAALRVKAVQVKVSMETKGTSMAPYTFSDHKRTQAGPPETATVRCQTNEVKFKSVASQVNFGAQAVVPGGVDKTTAPTKESKSSKKETSFKQGSPNATVQVLTAEPKPCLTRQLSAATHLSELSNRSTEEFPIQKSSSADCLFGLQYASERPHDVLGQQTSTPVTTGTDLAPKQQSKLGLKLKKRMKNALGGKTSEQPFVDQQKITSPSDNRRPSLTISSVESTEAIDNPDTGRQKSPGRRQSADFVSDVELQQSKRTSHQQKDNNDTTSFQETEEPKKSPNQARKSPGLGSRLKIKTMFIASGGKKSHSPTPSGSEPVHPESKLSLDATRIMDTCSNLSMLVEKYAELQNTQKVSIENKDKHNSLLSVPFQDKDKSAKQVNSKTENTAGSPQISPNLSRTSKIAQAIKSIAPKKKKRSKTETIKRRSQSTIVRPIFEPTRACEDEVVSDVARKSFIETRSNSVQLPTIFEISTVEDVAVTKGEICYESFSSDDSDSEKDDDDDDDDVGTDNYSASDNKNDDEEDGADSGSSSDLYSEASSIVCKVLQAVVESSTVDVDSNEENGSKIGGNKSSDAHIIFDPVSTSPSAQSTNSITSFLDETHKSQTDSGHSDKISFEISDISNKTQINTATEPTMTVFTKEYIQQKSPDNTSDTANVPIGNAMKPNTHKKSRKDRTRRMTTAIRSLMPTSNSTDNESIKSLDNTLDQAKNKRPIQTEVYSGGNNNINMPPATSSSDQTVQPKVQNEGVEKPTVILPTLDMPPGIVEKFISLPYDVAKTQKDKFSTDDVSLDNQSKILSPPNTASLGEIDNTGPSNGLATISTTSRNEHNLAIGATLLQDNKDCLDLSNADKNDLPKTELAAKSLDIESKNDSQNNDVPIILDTPAIGGTHTSNIDDENKDASSLAIERISLQKTLGNELEMLENLLQDISGYAPSGREKFTSKRLTVNDDPNFTHPVESDSQEKYRQSVYDTDAEYESTPINISQEISNKTKTPHNMENTVKGKEKEGLSLQDVNKDKLLIEVPPSNINLGDTDTELVDIMQHDQIKEKMSKSPETSKIHDDISSILETPSIRDETEDAEMGPSSLKSSLSAKKLIYNSPQEAAQLYHKLRLPSPLRKQKVFPEPVKTVAFGSLKQKDENIVGLQPKLAEVKLSPLVQLPFPSLNQPSTSSSIGRSTTLDELADELVFGPTKAPTSPFNVAHSLTSATPQSNKKLLHETMAMADDDNSVQKPLVAGSNTEDQGKTPQHQQWSSSLTEIVPGMGSDPTWRQFVPYARLSRQMQHMDPQLTLRSHDPIPALNRPPRSPNTNNSAEHRSAFRNYRSDNITPHR